MLYIIPLRRYIDSLCNAVKIPHKNIFAVLALNGEDGVPIVFILIYNFLLPSFLSSED